MKKSSLMCVRDYIKYGNHYTFQATLAKMRYWFKHLNRVLFSNQLYIPTLKLCKLNKADGLCQSQLYNDGSTITTITLCSGIHSSKRFVECLAHEMVHMWQMAFTYTMNHTETFLQWRRYIKHKLKVII